jgi:signal transduction histidine kinase
MNCSAHEILSQVVQSLSHKARHYRFQVRLSAREDRLLGDKVRLGQVFRNLLDNAFKFTPEQGVIAVATENAEGALLVTIQDSGRGFEGDAARLFKPFEQEKKAGPEGGLGLGLSICDGIVSAHGGVIRGESPGPGRGSTFSVRLPICSAPGL